jgi:hypothetical protein
MRQISVVLATAVIVIWATVTMTGMLAIGSSSTETGGVVRTSTSINVMKMMKDARDLPDQNYLAY